MLSFGGSSNSKDRKWLVKSSGRILGPYSTDEAQSLLRARKISMIDEIRQPQSYWKFIREHAEFEKIIAELRDEEANRLDSTTADLTDSMAKTQTDLVLPINDDLTPTPRPHFEKQDIRSIRSSSRASDALVPFVSQKSWVTIGLGFVAVVFLITVFVLIQNRNLIVKNRNESKLLEQQSPKERLIFAENLLDSAGHQLEARRIFEDLIAQLSVTDPLRSDAQLGLGLSFLREGNLPQAEQIFQNILFSSADRKEARWNLASSKIQRSEFQGALKDLELIKNPSPSEQMMISLGKSVAILGLGENEQEVSGRLSESLKEISNLSESQSNFRLEALLVRAVLQQRLNSAPKAQGLFHEILSEDPELTQKHGQNLLMDRQILKWDRLLVGCDYLMFKWGETALSKALGVYCSLQKKESPAAFQKMEDARAQFSKDFDLMGLQAYLLYQVQRDESQTVALLSREATLMSVRVLAMACEKAKDWACAQRHWSQIVERKPRDLQALQGLAQVQAATSHPDLAQQQLQQIFAISSNYRPALELKEKLNAP